MILRSHGIEIDLPDGWEGRIFRRGQGAPTLHAGTFALPHHDGEFGSHATARMPAGSAFLTLTEYHPGKGLEPGRGLFRSREIPLPLRHDRFHPRTRLNNSPRPTASGSGEWQVGVPYHLSVFAACGAIRIHSSDPWTGPDWSCSGQPPLPT